MWLKKNQNKIKSSLNDCSICTDLQDMPTYKTCPPTRYSLERQDHNTTCLPAIHVHLHNIPSDLMPNVPSIRHSYFKTCSSKIHVHSYYTYSSWTCPPARHALMQYMTSSNTYRPAKPILIQEVSSYMTNHIVKYALLQNMYSSETT